MFAALKDRVLGELAKGTHTEAFADGARFALSEAHNLAAPQPVVDREALAAALREHPLFIDACRCGWRPEGRVSLRLSQHAHHQADAVLALLNGTAK